MTAARLKTTIALAVIFLCGAALFVLFRPSPPTPDLRPHVALGKAMAREAAKLVGPGGKVTVVGLDTAAFPNKSAQAQLDAFFSEAKGAGLKVAQKSLAKLDPLRLVRPPPPPFLEGFRKGSEADVIVSFLGPPPITLEQRAKMPAKLPRVVAACTGETPKQVSLKTLFDAGLLHAAIIDRPGSGSMTRSSAFNFDEVFQVVTTANLADLPTASAKVAKSF